MPKVAQAQSDQVSLSAARQPRASGNVPAAAFGGDIVKGANDLVQAGLNVKNRIDTTSAEEALVGFERDKNALFFNPDDGYFNTQGRNAYDAAPVANKSLQALKKKYSDNLNEQSRQMFGKSADLHITKAQADIGRHSSQGLKAWETATIEAQVENTIENASLYWNDPQAMKVQRILGEQAVLDSAETTGIGAEATNERLQNYRSSFASNAVTAATQSRASDGKKMLDEMSKMLEPPDKIKLEKSIAAKQKSEQTQANARASVLTATRLVGQYDNRSDIQDEVNKISNPELRSKTMSESMRLFSQRRQAEKEAQGDSFEAGESHIANGGSAETFQSEDPEGWERLTAKQQKSLSSGKAVITDWNEYSGLITLPKTQLAKINPTDHFPKLAPAERKTLISAVKSAKGTGSGADKIDHQVGRTRSAQTTAAVEQIFGKKTKLGSKQIKQVDSFYSIVDDEVRFRESELERTLTSEEFTNVLSGLTRAVVQEGALPFGLSDEEVDISDIPADDVTALSKFLRDNNIPVTSDNLIRAHIQATN